MGENIFRRPRRILFRWRGLCPLFGREAFENRDSSFVIVGDAFADRVFT